MKKKISSYLSCHLHVDDMYQYSVDTVMQILFLNPQMIQLLLRGQWWNCLPQESA